MSEKSGYWDVTRCAWVGTEPTHGVRPAAGTEGDAPATADLPEQRLADVTSDAPVAPA